MKSDEQEEEKITQKSDFLVNVNFDGHLLAGVCGTDQQ